MDQENSPRALRARAAVRLAIASQDQRLGDANAALRNMAAAAEYERAAEARERQP